MSLYRAMRKVLKREALASEHFAQQLPEVNRKKFKKQIDRKMEPLAEEWRGVGPGQPATSTEEK